MAERFFRKLLPVFIFGTQAFLLISLARGQTGRHEAPAAARLIDGFIAKKFAADKIVPSQSADDAVFLRRAYLDLNGTIPSAAEARAFLDDKDAARREKLIDRLLASPNYGRHFGLMWCNLVTPRDANMIRPPDTKPLAQWFTEQFNQNKPWNKLVEELLTADGASPAGVFFILNGDSRSIPQPNIATRNLGQLFMGQQLQCAECHNHPFQKWKQDEFWGIAAFFSRVAPGGKGTASVQEKTGNKATIAISQDAFKNVGKLIAASVPAETQPKFDPAQPLRPVFAEWLTSPSNPYLARAAVNRLWGCFFGRGLVNPLMDMNEDNAPSHPELLDFLAREYIASGFDQKHLIRCICLSQAYQRSSEPTASNKDDDQAFARMNVKVVGPNALWDSLCVALEVTTLEPPAVKSSVKTKVGGTQPPRLSAREAFYAFYNTGDDDGVTTEFTQGIPQVLRLMNQGLFNDGGNTATRIAKLPNRQEAIEELYLAALSRRPTALEAQEAADFIRGAATPLDGYRGVFWALLNSSEFALNH